MSHGPESHHTHEAEEEPERIPIADPRDAQGRYRTIDSDFTTTHRGPNGDFYQIKNSSSTEADNRLYRERERAKKMRDALANDLYQITENGVPMRPAKSSDDFLHAAIEPGTETYLGNQDLGSVKEKEAEDGTTQINKGPLGGFISYGMGDSHSNERAAISERSASIVLSNEARQKALAEGKTPEEAQVIGAQVYREQEQFKADFKRGTFTQPEASYMSPTSAAPESEQDTPAYDDNPENSERRTKPLKMILKRIGHNVIYGAKFARKGGVDHATHANDHMLKDTIEGKVDQGLSKFEDADEKFEDNAREIIESLPFLTSLAIEQGTKELLVRIDLSLDRMTKTAEDGIEKGKTFAADQYKKAIQELAEQRERVIKAILDLYDRTISRRLRIWKRTGPIYNERVNSRIKELKDYLATKHPDDPRYTTTS